jgi:peptidyl-prolyl cis-trans isomerase B (cyclophilin B)
MTKKAFMTISVGSKELGTLQLVLYDDTVPRTVENFVGLFPRYTSCTFHRIIKGFMAQGGDFENGDGTGGASIFGKSFADENFVHKHDRRGVLSMANSGKDTNGSQFFITFRPTSHLDGRHVVFGHVDLMTGDGEKILDAMEHVQTGRDDVPRVAVTIADCGLIQQEKEVLLDPDEIDLNAQGMQVVSDKEASKLPQDDEIDLHDDDEADDKEEEVDDGKPKSKSDALRNRLKKLKMKMNQARHLNRQEVMREGERLGSAEGMAKERKRQSTQDKKLREKEWEARNAKALEVAAEAGVDGKLIVQPAADSIVST